MSAEGAVAVARTRATAMEMLVRVWRYGFAALIVGALLTDMLATIDAGEFVFLDYFGYFTFQVILLGAAMLVISAAYTGRPRPEWIEYARLFVAAYVVVVVGAYWGLVAGTDDVRIVWANLVFHGASIVALVGDWLLEGPRTSPGWSAAWMAPLYPLVWCVVVLVRGATDGWVPYEFLDPAGGYLPVAIMLTATLVAMVLAVIALRPGTRIRVVVPPSERR